MFEDLNKHQVARVKSNLSHVDKIIDAEIYDPTEGGYVDTHEAKRIRVIYIYKGETRCSTFPIGKTSIY